jgi:hypothetical protein
VKKRDERLRVVVVGPEDIVERLIQSAPMTMVDAPPYQLVGAPYSHERETVDLVEAHRGHADGFLFTGPVPHDLALGVLADVPAVHISLNGASLYGCLLSAVWHDEVADPSRISIDTLTEAEVYEAFRELGMPESNVRASPYQRSDTDATLVSFHDAAWRDGHTVVAVTGRKSVHDELRRRGVPVARMRPSPAAIRYALRIVVLLAGARGSESLIGASVIAVGHVSGPPDLTAMTGRWGDSLLSAHRVVREHARAVGAVTTELSPAQFLVLGTAESMEQLFERYQSNPLGNALSDATGLSAHVGIGIAHTATTAFERAVQAAARGAQGAASSAWVIGEDGASRAIGDTQQHRAVSRFNEGLTASERDYVVQLSKQNGDTAEGDPLVSAESVANQLGLTERSARRLLDRLVEAGAAWELPPWRTSQPGRPRRRWRVARLEDTEADPPECDGPFRA